MNTGKRMQAKDSLKNTFLIAMPSLKDPNFSQSVIYINEHTENGAMGLIINKPLQINLGSILEHLSIGIDDADIITIPVLSGGPVGQEHGFVIHNENGDDIIISASKDILKSIAAGKGPAHFLITLGYSGWGAGQIELEIARNDWLVAPFSPEVLFDTPINQRWAAAAEILGIDLNLLSDQIGHA